MSRVIHFVADFVLTNQSEIVNYSLVLVVLAGLCYLYKQVKSFK